MTCARCGHEREEGKRCNECRRLERGGRAGQRERKRGEYVGNQKPLRPVPLELRRGLFEFWRGGR